MVASFFLPVFVTFKFLSKMSTNNYTPSWLYDDFGPDDDRPRVYQPRAKNGRHPNHYGRGGSRNFFERSHPSPVTQGENDSWQQEYRPSRNDWYDDDFYARRHHANEERHYGRHDYEDQDQFERDRYRGSYNDHNAYGNSRPRYDRDEYARTAERVRETWHDHDYDDGFERSWNNARYGHDGEYRHGINRGWENGRSDVYEDERNYNAGRKPRHHYYDSYHHRRPAFGADYYGSGYSRHSNRATRYTPSDVFSW
jgi:hypothetical protein